MMRPFAVLAFALAACTPQAAPAPLPMPDASDAAPVAASCAAPVACTQACAAMTAAGCVVQTACACTLANVEAHRLIANPSNSGNPLTCADLVSVKTSADVTARGWSCGP